MFYYIYYIVLNTGQQHWSDIIPVLVGSQFFSNEIIVLKVKLVSSIDLENLCLS